MLLLLLLLSVGSIRKVLQLLLLLQTVVVRMLEISAPVLLLLLMRKPAVVRIALPQILWLQVLQCRMMRTAAAMIQRRRSGAGQEVCVVVGGVPRIPLLPVAVASLLRDGASNGCAGALRTNRRPHRCGSPW